MRLLSGNTLGKDEITAILRRNCTTFTPSERDRVDLRAVGADEAMLRAIAKGPQTLADDPSALVPGLAANAPRLAAAE